MPNSGPSEIGLLIGGSRSDAGSGKAFERRDPYIGEVASTAAGLAR